MKSMSDETMSWNGWLAAEKPALTVFAFLVLISVWLLTFMVMESIVLSFLLTFCVFVYVSEFFLPVQYGFDDNHVWKKIGPVRIRKEWKQLRSFYTDKNGILLSPFSRPSRLETFRGIYIRFAGGDRERIIQSINDKLTTDRSDV
ncbi:hypothetical protein JXA84_03445 [candidate division WOR-3 bacterium]|nr:hypothetical protein [candidate division WOR-3 bacterium]